MTKAKEALEDFNTLISCRESEVAGGIDLFISDESKKIIRKALKLLDKVERGGDDWDIKFDFKNQDTLETKQCILRFANKVRDKYILISI
jgi:hypothetical protein